MTIYRADVVSGRDDGGSLTDMQTRARQLPAATRHPGAPVANALAKAGVAVVAASRTKSNIKGCRLGQSAFDASIAPGTG